MKAINIVAIILIIGGFFGAVYGSFSYTKERQEAKLGPFELTVKDTHRVDIPIWLSIGAVLGGGVLLFANKKA
jgi:hypothetical protein